MFDNDIFAMKGATAINLFLRDLFGVWQLFQTGGLTDYMVECFVVYLAGHNRHIHEVLFGNDKDIAVEYERAFVGMTEVDYPLLQCPYADQLPELRLEARQPGNLSETPSTRLCGAG